VTTESTALHRQLQITERIDIDPIVKLSLKVVMLSLPSTAPAEYSSGK
jgi:hypothetical protein